MSCYVYYVTWVRLVFWIIFLILYCIFFCKDFYIHFLLLIQKKLLFEILSNVILTQQQLSGVENHVYFLFKHVDHYVPNVVNVLIVKELNKVIYHHECLLLIHVVQVKHQNEVQLLVQFLFKYFVLCYFDIVISMYFIYKNLF